MINTLEDFLEDQCGMVTPKLLERFASHREFVEKFLSQYNHDPDLRLEDYISNLWQFLPNPISDDFKN